MGGAATPARPPGPPRVAILLPLTGSNADLAAQMLKAAQLALDLPGAPVLDLKDTGGEPARAAEDAHEVVAAGDVMILGPLTAPETAAVAPIARAANLPVLAFTSNPARAAPGVWTLGITPGQQVRRLVGAVRDDNRTRIAAALPLNPFGDALAAALTAAAADEITGPPNIQRYPPGFQGLNDVLKAISDYTARRGDRDTQMKSLQASADPTAKQQAAALAATPVPPPPFDALLVAEAGSHLHELMSLLPYYDIAPPAVRVLGPALWAQTASEMGAIAGAWYAAPDPAARSGYVHAFAAKYRGETPPPLADLAFDAAAIARVLAHDGDFSEMAITRPQGFAGVDGVLGLEADGHVRRGLAVFEIDPKGGAHIVRPAPQDLSQPGV